MRVHRTAVRAVAGLVLAIVAGCATRSTNVDHRMLLPQAGARHAVEPTQFFVMPMSLTAPEPAFPELAEGTGAIDVTVCVEIWLSENGDVTRVAPFDSTQDCAAGMQPRAQAYVQSVVAALQQWEFSPAMICEFPPQSIDKRERGDCTGAEVTVRRVPVRLDYAFTFSSRNGRKQVGMARKSRQGDAPTGSTAR